MASPGGTLLRRPEQSLVDGEFVMTAADFRTIADMLHGDSGIKLQDSKATLVYSRLAKRIRVLGLADFASYCALLASPDGIEERQSMLAALTTNVTRFYREPHHFEHLGKTMLPKLIEEAKRGGRVRLWSSASSNGQEPYTMALTILTLCPEAARYDIRILATDIDPNMVAAGRAGVYDEATVSAVPAELRRRWFVPAAGGADGDLQVGEALRGLVAFRPLNLIGKFPMRGPFQVIFCRNVMIYFDAETQSQIWQRMVPLLSPGGVLYIGHSERVAGPAAAMVRPDGITTYRRHEGAAA